MRKENAESSNYLLYCISVSTFIYDIWNVTVFVHVLPARLSVKLLKDCQIWRRKKRVASLMYNDGKYGNSALFQTHTVKFELPNDASSNDSECDASASTLMLRFGGGHSWSMNFSQNGKIYQADSITFTYNLTDSKLFPNSSSNGNFHCLDLIMQAKKYE